MIYGGLYLVPHTRTQAMRLYNKYLQLRDSKEFDKVLQEVYDKGNRDNWCAFVCREFFFLLPAPVCCMWCHTVIESISHNSRFSDQHMHHRVVAAMIRMHHTPITASVVSPVGAFIEPKSHFCVEQVAPPWIQQNFGSSKG